VLTISPAVKLWYCPQAVNMRLGFDGLFALVKNKLKADPLSGHLFIFRNRTADRLKVLYWGGHGLSAGQFQMILDGIDLSRVRRFKRFSVP
jgi:transposase